MSRWQPDPEDQQRDIYRALVIAEYKDEQAIDHIGRDW